MVQPGVDPSPALDGRVEPGPVLTAAQVASWREQGFALVDDVLPLELLGRARDDARAVFPPAGSDAAEAFTDFGGQGRMAFPSASDAANAITLHPRLVRAVAELLGVDVLDLRLTQSEIWPKYGRRSRSGGADDNTDQRMHCDYPNHTLTHPPPWERPEAVELLLYLSEPETGGATVLVPRDGADDPAYRWPILETPGVGALEWRNDRESAEAYLRERAPEVASFRARELYPREVAARYRFGTLLFYRHDLWHRGTPVAPGALRLIQNLTVRRADAEWISTLHSGWAWAMYRPGQGMERLIARASVEQRALLGFPRPGHPYWTPETLAAVSARYGAFGMDIGPYDAAMRAPRATRA